MADIDERLKTILKGIKARDILYYLHTSRDEEVYIVNYYTDYGIQELAKINGYDISIKKAKSMVLKLNNMAYGNEDTDLTEFIHEELETKNNF